MSPNQPIFSTFIRISYLLVFIKKYIPGSIVYFVLFPLIPFHSRALTLLFQDIRFRHAYEQSPHVFMTPNNDDWTDSDGDMKVGEVHTWFHVSYNNLKYLVFASHRY